MPRYTIIFSFQKKVGCMGKDKDPEKSSISHTGTFFLSQCKKYSLLLPLLRNGCCLVDPFSFWRFYKVLHGSIAWFWKYSNKLWGCSKPANLSFWNMKSFQQSILIKRTVSPTTKVEVNLPDLRRIFAHGTWLAKCKAIYR